MTVEQHPLAIEATGLVKSFGETRAVDGVDLAVPHRLRLRRARPQRRRQDDHHPDAGHAACRPDAGSARVLGHDIVDEADAVRGPVSLTGQLASVDEDLTGRENLILLGRLLGPRSAPRAKARADELLEAFGLAEAAGRLVKNYSGGMRRRLDIAASIVVTPRADVPRRADHRPRPALAQPGVGHHPRAGRRGDDDPALHPVPGGGRPAGRRHRRHRPRQGDRRGDPGPAQGVGRHAARCTCACSTPSSGPEAEQVLEPASSAASRLEPDPAALSAHVRRRRPGAPRPSPSWPAPGVGSPTSRSASPAWTRSSWP